MVSTVRKFRVFGDQFNEYHLWLSKQFQHKSGAPYGRLVVDSRYSNSDWEYCNSRQNEIKHQAYIGKGRSILKGDG